MKLVTIHEAKTHLSRLIREALAGEEIVIAKGRTPLVRITPLPSVARGRRIGGAPWLVEYMAEDFDAPLEDFADYAK
jgi:antitoxin (DNA-binding transcriptional repressor) of toxin-antitoxin stability system